MNKHIYLL